MTTDADDITNAYAEAYDAERGVLLPFDAELVLIEHLDGQDDVEVAVLGRGWAPYSERRRGEVESLLRVEVADTAIALLSDGPPPVTGPLTLAVVERVNRLSYLTDGSTFIVNTFDAPAEAPRLWRLWCQERVLGAIP